MGMARKMVQSRSRQTRKAKVYVDRYGVWLALVSWLPFVGDLFSIALGFYKTNPWLTALLMLLGKYLRFLFWNLLLGAF